MITETKRLVLREFQLKDAEAMYRLNNHFDVIQYTGDEAFSSIEAAKEFLNNYDHYEKYGFGRWAVILKETNEFIGWCGLKYTAQFDEYDIGFRFFKDKWNKGYATESAQKCLDLGFQKFELEKIVGRTVKLNVASQKVLIKIGLTYSGDMDFHGLEGAKYEIKRHI